MQIEIMLVGAIMVQMLVFVGLVAYLHKGMVDVVRQAMDKMGQAAAGIAAAPSVDHGDGFDQEAVEDDEDALRAQFEEMKREALLKDPSKKDFLDKLSLGVEQGHAPHVVPLAEGLHG